MDGDEINHAPGVGPDGERAHRPLGVSRVLALCWVTYACYYLGRVNMAVALPAMTRDLGLSGGLVALIGGAYYWTYAVSQLVNGHLGDRVSPRRLVAIGLALSGVFNLLVAGAWGYWLLLGAWILNGWAQATGWGPMLRVISAFTDPEERGRVVALFSPCYVAGHALSWVLAAALLASATWRTAFWVPGVTLIVVAIGWYRAAPDVAPAADADGWRSLANITSGLAGLLRQKPMRWALLLAVLSGVIKEALTFWGPAYLVGQQGLALNWAGVAALVIPLGGVSGAVTAGWLLNRRRSGEARVMAGLSLVAVLAVVALWLLDRSQIVFTLMPLALLAAASHGLNAVLLTAVPLRETARGQVSSAAGSLDFASYVGGGVGAVTAGALSDVGGWSAVYVLWIVIGLLCVMVAIVGASRGLAGERPGASASVELGG
jgi:sugar phosphate permease